MQGSSLLMVQILYSQTEFLSSFCACKCNFISVFCLFGFVMILTSCCMSGKTTVEQNQFTFSFTWCLLPFHSLAITLTSPVFLLANTSSYFHALSPSVASSAQLEVCCAEVQVSWHLVTAVCIQSPAVHGGVLLIRRAGEAKPRGLTSCQTSSLGLCRSVWRRPVSYSSALWRSLAALHIKLQSSSHI